MSDANMKADGTRQDAAKGNRLGMGRKIAYGLGDMANNLVFQLSLLYLLFFYTDVFGLSPAMAGVIFVIARVIDAASNPIMGYIMDHTKAKSGNARVYLRFGALPLAAATVLMFLSPSFAPIGKFIWALVTYSAWSILYTMVNIPYASMTAQLTDDPGERTAITSVRMICMLLAVTVVSVATEPLSAAFADKRAGFLVIASLYAALAFILLEACYLSTRKISLVSAKSETAYRPRDLFKVLGSNVPAIVVVVTFFLGASAEYIRESSVVFYVTCNMGNASLVPVFLGIVVISMVLGNVAIPFLSERLDKKGTYLAGTALSCATCAVFQFIPYDNTVAILSCAALSSFGFSVVSTMGWAMLPDTVEYGELKTGVRGEGIIYAVFSFSQKLATAVGGGVVAFTLSLSGYVPKAAAQTETALFGIASTLGWMPLVFLVLSMVAVCFYGLDRKSFERIKAELGR